MVFEKFPEEGVAMKEEATYIMSYKNFMKMSSLSKPEIMEYIRKTDNPEVSRKYHTDTWFIRIEKAIKEIEYNPEVKREIDILVENLTNARMLK